MEIKKLFERDSSVQGTQGAKKNQVAAYSEQQQNVTQNRPGEDQVTLSSLSRQLSQISQILTEDDADRRVRIDEIKAGVENGTYAVDSSAVSRSLVSFAADTEDLK